MRRMVVGLAAAAVLVGLAHILLYAYGTPYARWPQTTTALTYWVNPQNQDGLNPTAILEDLQAAADTWNTLDATSPTLTYAGAITRTAITVAGGAVENQKNEVMFIPATDAGGMLAQAIAFALNGTIVEVDIAFYEGATWNTGATGCATPLGWYVRDTFTHELGHLFGLTHSPDVTATMYAGAPSCTLENRTLAQDDIDALAFLYKPGSVVSPPAAPSNLRVSSVGSTSISLAWQDNSPDETAFRIERSADGVVFTEVGTTAAGVVAYTAGALASGTAYTFRVRASNTSGNSAYSNLASGTTTQPPPPTTLTLIATKVVTGAGQTVALEWRNATARVEIFRGGTLLVLAKAGAVSYRDKVGSKNSPFTGSLIYQVCLQGTTNCSNSASVTF